MARIDAPRLTLLCNLRQLNRIRRTTIHPIYELHTDVESIRKSPCWLCQSRATIRSTSARCENPRELDWQVLSPEKIRTSCLPPFATLEGLYIYKPHTRNQIDKTASEDAVARTITPIYHCEVSAFPNNSHYVSCLPFKSSLRAKVLPTLRDVFLGELQLSGPVRGGVWEFVATGQVTRYYHVSSCANVQLRANFEDGS